MQDICVVEIRFNPQVRWSCHKNRPRGKTNVEIGV